MWPQVAWIEYSLCHSVIMQRSPDEKKFKIDSVVFECIHYKKKIILFITLPSLDNNDFSITQHTVNSK